MTCLAATSVTRPAAGNDLDCLGVVRTSTGDMLLEPTDWPSHTPSGGLKGTKRCALKASREPKGRDAQEFRAAATVPNRLHEGNR